MVIFCLQKDFERYFKDFRFIKKDLEFFLNLFSFKSEYAFIFVRVELIKFQVNIDLWNEYRVKDLGQFYVGLFGEVYLIIKGVVYKVVFLFDSNQICDKVFVYLI